MAGPSWGSGGGEKWLCTEQMGRLTSWDSLCLWTRGKREGEEPWVTLGRASAVILTLLEC